MSWYYLQAFNDLDDPFWACQYAVSTHPLYQQCDKCPSFSKCTIQPLPLLPQECSYKCVQCERVDFCLNIRRQLAGQLHIERAGKKYRRWRRFCLNPSKHVCLGCEQSLYCPLLAKKMNRQLPPMPSLLQCLRDLIC